MQVIENVLNNDEELDGGRESQTCKDPRILFIAKDPWFRSPIHTSYVWLELLVLHGPGNISSVERNGKLSFKTTWAQRQSVNQ